MCVRRYLCSVPVDSSSRQSQMQTVRMWMDLSMTTPFTHLRQRREKTCLTRSRRVQGALRSRGTRPSGPSVKPSTRKLPWRQWTTSDKTGFPGGFWKRLVTRRFSRTFQTLGRYLSALNWIAASLGKVNVCPNKDGQAVNLRGISVTRIPNRQNDRIPNYMSFWVWVKVLGMLKQHFSKVFI